MRRFTAPLLSGILAASIILLAACAAPGPEIRRDSNPSVNMASYKTFGYFSPLATDNAGYESVITARLKDSTRRVMESKGYVFADSNADVLVNFYLNISDKQEVRSSTTSVGFYGYRRGYYGGYGAGISTPQIETVNYKTGTLSIDLVDAKQKAIAWQATAEGRVPKEALKNPGPVIDGVVTEMMAPLTGPGPQ